MSFQNYQIGKKLGEGAFGSVCIVTNKTDKKLYAMKSVKMSKLDLKEKQNALNEIRYLYSLNHKNIIGYKDAFYDDSSKTLNIIMELADDGDIAGKIKQIKNKKLKFDENTIWKILIQLIQGLKYLHDNNIIHRDLKSANIFLMKNGLIKIGDLNVSKLSNGMAKTQTGTPYYAAPEIWVDKPYDNKVDIWSVGCIIYEMCSLLPPFRGTSLVNLANNIRKGIYPPIPKEYSKDLSSIISQMLIVDSKKRPSCQQLINNPIILNRIDRTSEIYVENNEKKAELIKTIKIPSKVKDYNKILPHNKKPKVKREEEMMKNDEYETMKATMFKQVSQENKKNDNVKLVNKDNNESKQRNQIETPKIKKEDDKKVVISNNNNQKKKPPSARNPVNHNKLLNNKINIKPKGNNHIIDYKPNPNYRIGSANPAKKIANNNNKVPNSNNVRPSVKKPNIKNKVVIEKYNYQKNKKPVKVPVGYKPKIGNKK